MFAKYSLNSSILSVRSLKKNVYQYCLFLLVLFFSLLSRARLCCLYSLVVFFVKDNLASSVNIDTLFLRVLHSAKCEVLLRSFSFIVLRMILHFQE